MARSYRRIRAVPDPPLGASAARSFRAYEVIAWVSMFAGLALLAGIVFAAWFGYHNVLPSVTDSRVAKLSDVVGTVEVLEKQTPRWTVAGSGQELHEGDSIRTNNGSRALIQFFDLSTATLYPVSQVTLGDMRTNHFNQPISTPRSDISVVESSGRVLFGVAHLNPLAQATFSVTSGSVTAALTEGSYNIKVMSDETFEVVATRGKATVQSSKDTPVIVQGGERTRVRPGSPPDAPLLGAEDLIGNGDFSQLDKAGKPVKWDIAPALSEASDVAGSAALATDDGQTVVRFKRSASTYHGENRLSQVINQDVTDYSIVRLELRLKVMSQSVSGGGEQGSEYPLLVRVNYLDENGAPAFYVHGFYVQNDQKLPVTNAEQIPAGEWVTLAGEHGIQLQGVSPRPQFIQSIEVQASGHDYASEIQKVALIVE